MAKKKVSKKSTRKKVEKSEIMTLTDKYVHQMAEFGINKFATFDPNAIFKKCSILNSDEFIFVSSSHLTPSTGI